MINIFCAVSKNELHELEGLVIPSLSNQVGISEINLTLINYSGLGKIFKKVIKRGKCTVKIDEISKKKNCGFGESHNFAFNTFKPKDFFIIINPGYLNENSIKNIINTYETNSKKIGLIEGRQLPFSHPKKYDKKTKITPWASGSFLLVKSDFFQKIKGFDENFWMYLEDVDLSWRAWLEGYNVLFENTSVLYHYTGEYFKYRTDRFYYEHYWSARNFIYLLKKYWGKTGEMKAMKLFLKTGYSLEFKNEVLEKYKIFSNNIIFEKPLLNKNQKNKYIQVKGFNLFHSIER